MFVVLPDSLFPLRFPDLGLLVPLGHNVLESGSDDGPLELLGLLGPLLGGLLLNTLLVLAPVQHGPGHLAGVALQQVGLVAAAIQEAEGLEGRQGSISTPITFITLAKWSRCSSDDAKIKWNEYRVP